MCSFNSQNNFKNNSGAIRPHFCSRLGRPPAGARGRAGRLHPPGSRKPFGVRATRDRGSRPYGFASLTRSAADLGCIHNINATRPSVPIYARVHVFPHYSPKFPVGGRRAHSAGLSCPARAPGSKCILRGGGGDWFEAKHPGPNQTRACCSHGVGCPDHVHTTVAWLPRLPALYAFLAAVCRLWCSLSHSVSVSILCAICCTYNAQNFGATFKYHADCHKCLICRRLLFYI